MLIVVVDKAAERGFKAAQDNRGVAGGAAGQIGIADYRPVRPPSFFLAAGLAKVRVAAG